jgi:UPF0716 family protein affecting phage T7 exclusion
MIPFTLWLLYLRLCAYLGSKRVIGAFDGVLLCIFFSFIGFFIMLSSRRLNDDLANTTLIKKYKPLDQLNK